MRTISFSLTCFFLLLFFTSYAQKDSVSVQPLRTNMYSFSAGYSNIDVSVLNQFLASSASGSFSNNFGVMGLQSINEFKRVVHGLTFQYGMSERHTQTNYAGIAGNDMEYYASSWNLLLEGGYSVISTKRIKLYPLGGVGIGSINANYERVNNLSIAQFSNNPGVQGQVTKYITCFDAALNVDFFMPSKHRSTSLITRGGIIGLRVGYTKGFGNGHWEFTGARVQENPSYNPGMFYARVHFGLYNTRPRRWLWQ